MADLDEAGGDSYLIIRVDESQMRSCGGAIKSRPANWLFSTRPTTLAYTSIEGIGTWR